MPTNKIFNVFLVDDDVMFLHMLKETFSEVSNIKTHLFYSGEECLKNLDLNPDIIVLDYFFDNAGDNAIDGMETLKRIISINPDSKVIMLTGQEEGSKVYEFIQEGAEDYVIKDLHAFDNILEAVNGIIEDL